MNAKSPLKPKFVAGIAVLAVALGYMIYEIGRAHV